jgi:hypothetical protein
MFASRGQMKLLNDALASGLAARLARRPATIAACSVCLSIRCGTQWLAAEHAIRELRSYERDAPPRLRSAICDKCASDLARRRRGD